MKKLLLASALCMALPVAAMAQSMKDGDLSAQDKMFIKKAGDAGLAQGLELDAAIARARRTPPTSSSASSARASSTARR